MLGYWRMPEATAEALKDGWMHTGDLATVDEEHYIYILDRAKDMMISGGENVYSVEVEQALSTHPAVLEAAVIGIPDERWGEAVHAVVVCKPGMQVSGEELITHARTRIAGYKVPRSIEFHSEALPKSGAGKILKRELREPSLGRQEPQGQLSASGRRQTMYDVIVVGARCAGSPTAMLLGRLGYRILLLDRATFPSDAPRCHFIQPPGVTRLTALGTAR